VERRTLEAAATPGGLTLNGRGTRALNLRLAPATALRSPLQVDLEIIGAWLSATKPQVGFVQIGAFDGRTNDPIYDLVLRHGWQGVLVEPQPEPFTRLRETYADVDGLVLVNAAVAEQRGSMTLWRVGNPQPDDPWWVAQAASFSREHLVGHISDRPDLHDRIIGQAVEAMTLSDVFERSPAPVDILQIDAEGYDAKIVAMLDQIDVPPTVVRFEHRNLSPADHASTIDRLAGRGYRFVTGEDDTLAVRHTAGRGSTATR
jgi:FkbM family methyltransferase